MGVPEYNKMQNNHRKANLAKKQNLIWSSNFAYATGLLTADGNLSSDGRHIIFVSKDLDLIHIFKKCLGLTNKISKKSGGYSKDKSKKYYFVQFGSVRLYNFFKNIGLTPNKSKTIEKLLVPREYFSDFLRGLIDGDGHIHFFRHPESQFLQLNLRIISGSYSFLNWIRKTVHNYFGVLGKIRIVQRAYELNYYKRDSKKIFRKIYNSDKILYLKRKFRTAELFFSEGGGTGIRTSLRS